jgi:hypothetical protein
MGDRYDRFHFGVMNVGARIFGVGLLLVGPVFLLTAIFGDSDRVLYALVGVLAIVGGVAFLVVKPTSRKDVDDFFAGRPGERHTGKYEKRK